MSVGATRRLFSAAHGLLVWASRTGRVPSDVPSMFVALPRVAAAPPDVLTEGEIERVLNEVQGGGDLADRDRADARPVGGSGDHEARELPCVSALRGDSDARCGGGYPRSTGAPHKYAALHARLRGAAARSACADASGGTGVFAAAIHSVKDGAPEHRVGLLASQLPRHKPLHFIREQRWVFTHRKTKQSATTAPKTTPPDPRKGSGGVCIVRTSATPNR